VERTGRNAIIHSPSDLTMWSQASRLRTIWLVPYTGPKNANAIRVLRRVCGEDAILAIIPRFGPSRWADALEIGADLSLPLSCPDRLLDAALNALTRRLCADWSPTEQVHLSAENATVRINGQIFPMRRTEYRIFEYLVTNRGRWISERELLQTVLEIRHDRETSLIRVHVRHIRRALREQAACLVSRRGNGYRFCAHLANDEPVSQTTVGLSST
jgi:DNA-binding response OmpR family regulator